MSQTLFDRIWNAHLVTERNDGRHLIYMDRHVLHELHAPHAFEKLREAGRTVYRPDLTFACQDHTVASSPGRDENTNPDGTPFLRAMREGSREFGIHLFDVNDRDQGISHVVGPELGIVLPGATYACPDSHACTVGGLGVLAFGCGTTELEHVLATQVLALKKPKTMRVRLDGSLAPGITAKDVILRIIAEVGVDGGSGHAVEYAGPVAQSLPIEGRLTLCNMAIEMGARNGFIAPDEATADWLEGRPWVPTGARWEAMREWWKSLRTDDDSVFDKEVTIDCDGLEPQITWGIDPSQVIGISGRVPDPATVAPDRQAALRRALDYMDLAPGTPIEGVGINRVFIGSCTNARLPDLEAAAAVLRGRKVADGVTAMVVPGSSTVKRQAEEIGLDKVFLAAGFTWGEAGCSMCAGGNGDRGARGDRCVSTTNRNFEGRQGEGVRTHLVGPAMAAAAAVAGCITDVRRVLAGES